MPQSFTREDLERVARLARLELDASEQDLFARQVAGILEYADQIQRVDTTDVEPTSHPAGTVGAMRAGRRPPVAAARRGARGSA